MNYFKIICVLLLFPTQLFASADNQSALIHVNGQIEILQKNLTQTKNKQNDLQQQLKTAEEAIGNITSEVNHLNQAINQEKQQLAQLNAKHAFYLNNLKIQHEMIDKQIYTIFKLGQASSLTMLLNQENPTSLSRYLIYSRYLALARIKLIADINKTLPNLSQNMQLVAEHQQSLETLYHQKLLEENNQQQSLNAREKIIDALNQQSQSQEDKLNQLMANQKALKDILTALKTVAKNDVSHLPFEDLKGKLRWPVQGKIQATYGSTLDLGNQHLTGVILKAPVETPVRAIYSGKIIFANWLRGFGLLIIINHGNNYMSLYGRNQALYAKVGDEVRTGDVIAETGKSGGYTKPGLYFEIRQNGIPVNPNSWCV